MAGPHIKLPDIRVTADWKVESELLSLWRIPLEGAISSQMTGLISEIAMQITPDYELEVHHCVAQIRDLRVNFHGSMAAEIIHWFRQSITRTIRKTLEDEYCEIMKQEWLPWVEAQLSQFPTNLTISYSPEILLIQSLQSIAMNQQNIDIRMRSDLMWSGEFVESAPVENQTLINIESLDRSTRMIDMYIDEHTVQSVLAAAHFANHLKTSLESPFLRTNCDVLCLGTVLPELVELIPNRTLKVDASTLSPPVISLQTGKTLVFLNATLSVYSDPPVEDIKGEIVKVNVETEFTLSMEMRNKKVKGYINMVNAQANLVESSIGLLSQKTIDFFVNMSIPFLEDAVDLFIGKGLFVGDPFQFPSTNEHLSIELGCVRWQADISMPSIQQHTPRIN
ncbi:hypothetical protein WR25_19959 [Diploscapter pachys]|uniref:Lipid-binding serum glycoprotein C-terminal domain-containing protein n=1 Tax=Diploscapter pachys TaxID=2018661 RepID=A0A2A2KAM0_9BILA|nr:hypothetical protein WR25_19959 [Diploscapter pachys]